MKQVTITEDSGIKRIEQLLPRVEKEFAQYRLRLERTRKYVQALLARQRRGFSNLEMAAIYEVALDYALQDYFRLRDQIVWRVKQAHRIIIILAEIERQEAAMNDVVLVSEPCGAPVPLKETRHTYI